MKENKMEVATPGFEPAPQLPPAKKMRFLTTRPRNHYSNLLLKYLSLPFTLFEPYGAVFIMNSKIHLRKNSSNEYFKTISHYLRSINGLVLLFAAFAEVQVTVLSVLNLPRQGFPATCPIGHCCVCSPLLFASEILCDSPAYNKQRMNKKSLAVLPGNPKCTMTCIWRLYYLFMACC